MEKSFFDIIDNVKKFENEAHQIFSKYELSKSRIISLEKTKARLSNLSINQDRLLKDAIFCIESGIYRPAYIMAWAAFIDLYEEKIASDGLKKIHQIRPAWSKFKNLDELRENIVENQLVEVGKEIGLLSKHEVSILKGNLTKRNKCAHPSDFSPDMNETLGYLSEIMKYIEKISIKNL